MISIARATKWWCIIKLNYDIRKKKKRSVKNKSHGFFSCWDPGCIHLTYIWQREGVERKRKRHSILIFFSSIFSYFTEHNFRRSKKKWNIMNIWKHEEGNIPREKNRKNHGRVWHGYRYFNHFTSIRLTTSMKNCEKLNYIYF